MSKTVSFFPVRQDEAGIGISSMASIRTDGLSRYSMKSSSSKIYALPGTPRGKIISKMHALTLWTGLIFGARTRVLP